MFEFITLFFTDMEVFTSTVLVSLFIYGFVRYKNEMSKDFDG